MYRFILWVRCSGMVKYLRKSYVINLLGNAIRLIFSLFFSSFFRCLVMFSWIVPKKILNAVLINIEKERK